MSFELIYSFKKRKASEKLHISTTEKFCIGLSHFYSVNVTARFQKSDGTYLEPKRLLFDTGASITLLTSDMLELLGIKEYVPYLMSGVIKDKKCKLPVNICRVTMKLEDEFGNVSPSFDLWAAIADRENVPLLLGMADIINQFNIEIKYDMEQANIKNYLEMNFSLQFHHSLNPHSPQNLFFFNSNL
ncbi:MAG: hypothetical protein ACE5KT_02130 [Methanosarcinales archaeon]